MMVVAAAAAVIMVMVRFCFNFQYIRSKYIHIVKFETIQFGYLMTVYVWLNVDENWFKHLALCDFPLSAFTIRNHNQSATLDDNVIMTHKDWAARRSVGRMRNNEQELVNQKEMEMEIEREKELINLRLRWRKKENVTDCMWLKMFMTTTEWMQM